MEKAVLDPQQLAAVESPHQFTMVSAGAGSGKTRVLVERIAHLIEVDRVHPAEIMAMTFTRKAAAQMRERLQERVGHKANQIVIGTIHSLALKFIRMYGSNLGLRPWRLSVYGPWEESFLLKDTAATMSFRGKVTVLADYYRTGDPPPEGHPQRRLFDVFISRLRRFSAVTYGQLMLGMRELAKEIVGHQVRHLLVDEVQDIDLLQWQIIDRLVGALPSMTLFMVGDIDQSIYEWRGAAPEEMLRRASGFEIFYLENNYRSQPAIVQAADRLIGKNLKRLPKKMNAVRKGGRTPLVLASEIDSAAAASLVAAEPNGAAVLARNHVLLVKLSQLLKEMGVEHNYCGRASKLMQSEEFRRAHAVLQLVHNPYDDFSFSLARLHLGVTDDVMHSVELQAIADGSSFLQAWIRHHAPERWEGFFAGADDVTLKQLMEDLVLLTTPEFDLVFSMRLALEFAETGANLEEYLEWVATFDLQEEVATDYDGIQLMTIHAAKGLEFPTVILLGWNEGLFPSSHSIPDGVEEERRLAYVALTRAQDRLIVTSRPEETESRGKRYTNSVSRFMAEMAA